MAALRGKINNETLHEPTHPRPLPGGEQAFVRGAKVPLLGGVRGGFLVPMHAQKRMEAFHEPQCRAGVSPASADCADGTEPLALARSLGRRDACPTLGALRLKLQPCLLNPASRLHVDGTVRAADLPDFTSLFWGP